MNGVKWKECLIILSSLGMPILLMSGKTAGPILPLMEYFQLGRQVVKWWNFLEWMKKAGRKHGTNKILTSKRGGHSPSLFLLFSFLFILNNIGYSQFYSSKLFPGSTASITKVQESYGYSITTFYDHTYKYSINDETLSHIYRAMVYQDMNLSLKNNSILTVGHRYNDFWRCGLQKCGEQRFGVG